MVFLHVTSTEWPHTCAKSYPTDELGEVERICSPWSFQIWHLVTFPYRAIFNLRWTIQQWVLLKSKDESFSKEIKSINVNHRKGLRKFEATSEICYAANWQTSKNSFTVVKVLHFSAFRCQKNQKTYLNLAKDSFYTLSKCWDTLYFGLIHKRRTLNAQNGA